MPLSRRSFLTAVGAGAAGVAVYPALDRSRDLFAATGRIPRPVLEGVIRLDKNENPAGPFASARAAVPGSAAEWGRYPGAALTRLEDAIAKMHGVKSEQVVVTAGSGEILDLCTKQFTTSKRALIAGKPTFETCAELATRLQRPVVAVPVTKTMHLDLDAMAAAAKGAGLIYLCNPNNPTSTVHGSAPVKAFIARVRRESPDTYILVDEAYHEYVEDPGYATMIPLTNDSHVIVSRTFSKVFGMAGMRCGYAISTPETIGILATWRLDSGVSQPTLAAALTAIGDTAAVKAEQKRNHDVRALVTKWFTDRKYTVAKSDANFVFVDIRKDVRPVIAACLEKGVAVGRPFPPLETHLRLSIGLQPETEKALVAVGQALA